MWHAARGGKEEVVKALLRIADEMQGVNWDAEDRDGMTPVDSALRSGHHAIAKLLCDYYGRSVPGTTAESMDLE